MVSTNSPALPRPPGQLGTTSVFTLLGGLWGAGLSSRSLLGLAGPEPSCWAPGSAAGSCLGLAGAGLWSWAGGLLLGLQLGGGRAGQGWQRPLQHAGAVPGRDLQAQMLHEPGHDFIYIAVDTQVCVAVLRGAGTGQAEGEGLGGPGVSGVRGGLQHVRAWWAEG